MPSVLFCALQETDSGTYTCVASSASGESSWSGTLTVRGTGGSRSRCLSVSSHLRPHTRLPLFSRIRSFFDVPSVRFHPASRAPSEAGHDRGDQKHGDPHLAVQPARRRRCRHLLHHRGLQVTPGASLGTSAGCDMLKFVPQLRRPH